MRLTWGLIAYCVIFSTSNLFADCDWVLWKSRKYLNPALMSAIYTKKIPEKPYLDKWEYLDAFPNKKECRVSRKEKFNKFVSLQNEALRKEMRKKRANEAAAKNLNLPLEKRFPVYKNYIDTQRRFGRNDKDIEGLILEDLEKKKGDENPKEVKVDEEGAVLLENGTYSFQCIPIMIDPRKG